MIPSEIIGLESNGWKVCEAKPVKLDPDNIEVHLSLRKDNVIMNIDLPVSPCQMCKISKENLMKILDIATKGK